MKVLVLGHNGMLGHMMVNYLSSNNISSSIINFRWPTEEFKKSISYFEDYDYIINCIGAIPQHKKHQLEDYINLNVSLPVWLAKNFKGRIIHPTTDCEFSGNKNIFEIYNKTDIKDIKDDYGLSKAIGSTILEWFFNVKQIRTSIIGPEIKNKVSLFEWFFSQTGEVKGFSNHYWNGITTLEWSKLALHIMEKWENHTNVIQVSTTPTSKYELLKLINKVFNLNKNIISVKNYPCNKCLDTDFPIKKLEKQLEELKDYVLHE